VITADQDLLSDPVTRAVRKMRTGTRERPPVLGEGLQARGEGQSPERHDHGRSRQKSDLADQVAAAVVELAGRGTIARRSAPAGRRDERSGKTQAIAGADGLRAVGEAGGEQGPKEKVSRFVAGEDAAGAVSSVGRRRQTNQENPRGRVAERWKRTGPIRFAAKSARRMTGRGLAPGNQARTPAAGDDFPLEGGERPIG
jgi:hypothetical protein